jgi:hypothetical protein
MTILDGFRPVGEVTADSRARLTIGKAGVRENDRYAVSIGVGGEILLTPVVSIPKRELLIWENDELRASLARGLGHVAAGRTKRLDWLTADDPDE